MKALKKSQNQLHRVALYIRVSTEEQAANPEGSIKSQEQRLRQHVEFKSLDAPFGEITGVFIDRARSGKDTNRPELQRLLSSIRKGEVTLVLVTELSRLSRSIKDFSEIWELMRAHGCEFQSLREQFDTTTAAGEMVIYTIANISQFERKQCSERISANFTARAQRGLFNGGSVPFGYELDPDKRGHLKINADDAATIREAFAAFLNEGSLSRAAKSLNDRGFKLKRRRQGGIPRLGHFMVENLHGILTNPAYIGVRAFVANGEHKMVPACWEPIMDELTFKRVGALLKKNRYRLKPQNKSRYPFLLSGLSRCGTCGDTMNGKSAHGNGGKIPYYEHGWATKRMGTLNKSVFACQPHRVQARILEPLVWEEVNKLLTDPFTAHSIIEEAQSLHAKSGHVAESDKLRSKVEAISAQIEALAEHLVQIPKGVSPAPVFAQMERLEGIKTKAQAELEESKRSAHTAELPAAFKDYASYLKFVRGLASNTIAPELRPKVIQKLIHKVEILPDTFRVHYFAGETTTQPPNKKAPEQATPGLPLFLNSSSNRLTNGWLDWD